MVGWVAGLELFRWVRKGSVFGVLFFGPIELFHAPLFVKGRRGCNSSILATVPLPVVSVRRGCNSSVQCVVVVVVVALLGL